MTKIHAIINILNENNTKSKNNLLELLLKTLESTKILSNEDRALVLNYSSQQVSFLITAIHNAKNYREKDYLFTTADFIIGIILTLCKSPDKVPEDLRTKVDELVPLLESEQIMETTVNKIFAEEKIEEAYIDRLTSLLTSLTDEFQRGKFYSGLLNYKDKIGNLTPEASKKLSDYISSEQKRYLSMKELSPDCLDGLEFSVDACKYLLTDDIIENLYKILELEKNNINVYAVETLLTAGKDIPKKAMHALANDLVYASLTYAFLENHKKTELFPKELSDPVYLAKSDLVHWLTYPTELGKAPDKIEYIGRIKKLFKTEVFHVFKFTSDSDNLDDEIKNKWLIGWSSNEGGTFSNFDKYADYDLGNNEKTLKNIKKKLIG
ncbi:MAG: hypothetical protein E7675_04885 [Ruminococcaceae bacterium]|nr:hypothetical protein [Oscillospiraceae bacterium]